MSRSFRPYVSLVLFALFTASSLWAQDAQITPEQKLNAAAEVLQQLNAGAADVEVIVSLVEPAGKPVEKDWDSRPKLRQWQAAVNARRNEVLAGLAPDDFKPQHQFENQSGFSGRVTRKGLENLARDPGVISIQYSRPVQPQLRQGLPLMNALATRPNYGGAGVSIAIVDTGIDYRHPDLSLGSTNFPNGKVIGGYDIGDSDPNPLPNTVAHGTACPASPRAISAPTAITSAASRPTQSFTRLKLLRAPAKWPVMQASSRRGIGVLRTRTTTPIIPFL